MEKGAGFVVLKAVDYPKNLLQILRKFLCCNVNEFFLFFSVTFSKVPKFKNFLISCKKTPLRWKKNILKNIVS